MHKKLRVLCILGYVSGTPRYEDSNVSLVDCDVVVVDTYDAAKTTLQIAEHIPPFDIVLSDFILFKDRSENDIPCLSPALFKWLLDEKLVQGLGIFVPQGYESSFKMSDGYTVTVASQNCWNFDGSRNWQELCDLVVKTSLEADGVDFFREC